MKLKNLFHHEAREDHEGYSLDLTLGHHQEGESASRNCSWSLFVCFVFFVVQRGIWNETGRVY